MTMALQGRARVRRVGNGLCVPLPTREAREDGIKAGDIVEFIVTRPTPIRPEAFGIAKKYFRGFTTQQLMDEEYNEKDR